MWPCAAQGHIYALPWKPHTPIFPPRWNSAGPAMSTAQERAPSTGHAV